MSLLEGFAALDPRWKLAGVLGGLLLLTTQCAARSTPASIPAEIEKGSILLGFQLAGEEAVYAESGMEVLDVHGDWVQIRFGQDKASDRWFNFGEMAAFMLAPQ